MLELMCVYIIFFIGFFLCVSIYFPYPSLFAKKKKTNWYPSRISPPPRYFASTYYRALNFKAPLNIFQSRCVRNSVFMFITYIIVCYILFSFFSLSSSFLLSLSCTLFLLRMRGFRKMMGNNREEFRGREGLERVYVRCR